MNPECIISQKLRVQQRLLCYVLFQQISHVVRLQLFRFREKRRLPQMSNRTYYASGCPEKASNVRKALLPGAGDRSVS